MCALMVSVLVIIMTYKCLHWSVACFPKTLYQNDYNDSVIRTVVQYIALGHNDRVLTGKLYMLHNKIDNVMILLHSIRNIHHDNMSM